MANLDEQGRPDPRPAGDEAETLLGFLDFQRATLAWKCSGLDAAALRATLPPSPLTLGGLLKHMACVEDYWFSHFLHGNPQSTPWNELEWTEVFTSATQDDPDDLRKRWEAATARSRDLTTPALATGLHTVAKRKFRTGEAPNLRFILTHMIEEYARHNGHADLLRESIDGQTGS
ncbi:DinB family protein [Paractinoplanes rishiriensis]|uniref:Mini-circle protein n=1 Tax=Paractinoplanes rishiriensis TaxID=1050105 RepID=A0A919JY95_9ACTN|nr:DinB family protein [Actinoplanes rishiriensis]GIE95434.1 mini-circle protein [Actinoplanes rishiriensis]